MGSEARGGLSGSPSRGGEGVGVPTGSQAARARHNCATVFDALPTLHTLQDVEAFESTAKYKERPPFTGEEQAAILQRKRELGG